jgi:tRNA(Ile)-lysidine synthase
VHRLTPDPAAVARFRADFEALAGRAPDAERRLGIAVSGGADSLALLLLAAATYPREAIAAATVDHGYRPEARAEAGFVHEICAQIGVTHDILASPEPPEPHGNLQTQARGMRYELLSSWAAQRGVAWVATAHQQDDVAEGFLMRARRGSGVGGLAAIPAVRPIADFEGAPLLVRPLLGWSRAELAAIVAAADLEPVADPSNRDARFDRSRMRALLAETRELPADRLALAAANLRHAEDALDWLGNREWAARSETSPGSVSIDPAGLPYEIRRRLAERAVMHFVPDWRGTGLDRLVAALDSGQPGTIAEVQARPVRGRWRFTLAPARRSH